MIVNIEDVLISQLNWNMMYFIVVMNANTVHGLSQRYLLLLLLFIRAKQSVYKRIT